VPTEIYRATLMQRLMGAFVLAFMTPVAVGMAVTAFVLMSQDFSAALILALIAAAMAFLVGYVARDAYAKWTLRAAFGPTSVALRLPAGRSLIHELPAFDGVIEYADMLALETRLEAYRSFGMAAMQRAYGLRLRSGALIILGEDRALGTRMAQLGAQGLADKLAARAGLTIADLGMVEGRGGVLLVAGAAPEAWSAPSLEQDQQTRLWRRVASTGAVPLTIFLTALLISSAFG